MACFLVPAIIGVALHRARKKFPERLHAGWLTAMIAGGAAGLAVEHFAHGEIVPWPPFLTAMASPLEAAAMLQEMAAVGIPMTLALVAAWAALVIVCEKTALLGRCPAQAPAPSRP